MDESRRNFVKLMGLLFGGLALGGCRRTELAPGNVATAENADVALWKAEVREAMGRSLPAEDFVPVAVPGARAKFPGEKNRFGMAIDLDLCNHCGECILACMLENNIPRVSADGASKGRYMHWIEMRGGIPVMCSQCGDAPCERVCPTGAAVASPDGPSAMVYSRCIGSRFCAANCPSRTRKFNYEDSRALGLAAKFNPEVPLRERGVMEKCSLCVQRLQNDRLRVRMTGGDWRGKTVQSACSAACPAHAIVFGNWLDPESPLSLAVRGRGVYALKSVAKWDPSVVYLMGKV
ncbi:MAG: hypothetical protein WCS54_04875 [Fibrobacteraceae bacterium]